MKTAKIIGIVRYSILTDNRVKKGWTISKKLSFRDLEKEIFCPERLLNRGLLFSRLTLPSLNANVRDWANLKVVVVTSLDLPSWHMIELESICKAYPFVKIIKINTEASAFNEAVNKYIDDETSEDETYFTFRIDDDDALSNDFIEIIRPYLNKSFAGTAISLPLGYSGLFNTKKRIVTQYGETYSILNAQALGFISSTKCKKKHIFDLGARHRRIDRVVPVLLISNKHAYFRTLHNQASMYHGRNYFERVSRTMGKITKVVSLDEILSRINIERDLFKEKSDKLSKSKLLFAKAMKVISM